MIGVQPQPDQCDVRPLPRRHRAHFLDVDLAGYHLVPQPGHDLGEQLESLALLVRDQDTEVPDLVQRHRNTKVARTPSVLMRANLLGAALITRCRESPRGARSIPAPRRSALKSTGRSPRPIARGRPRCPRGRIKDASRNTPT